MKPWTTIFLLATIAAFSLSAAPCIDNREDLLRYPSPPELRVTHFKRLNWRQLGPYARRATELGLYSEWSRIGKPPVGMDLATYTAHLRDILHEQGVRTTLETPEEGHNTLVLESVAPEGNPMAKCYLDMAHATEVKRLVVQLTEVDYRERAMTHGRGGKDPYFSRPRREIGLPMDIVLNMIDGGFHPDIIHEFRHAAFSVQGEHSFFNHAFLRMDSSISLFGDRVDSATRNLPYREYLSVEEIYNFALDATFYLDRAMLSSPTSSYNWQEFRSIIFTLEVISKSATDLATIFLEEFQDSPTSIRSIRGDYGYIYNTQGQVLMFKVSPAMTNMISNANPNQTADAWKTEVQSSLGEMVTMASFAGEKAEHILELLESEPDNHVAIRANTEELVFFLQDQLFPNDDEDIATN